jgi:hypothetical protein
MSSAAHRTLTAHARTVGRCAPVTSTDTVLDAPAAHAAAAADGEGAVPAGGDRLRCRSCSPRWHRGDAGRPERA